jgi:AcrR family transcriptional regulator
MATSPWEDEEPPSIEVERLSSPHRLSPKGSRTRAAVLNGTEELMLAEGYAAVTYRGVAARAGVTPANVQYYFPTIDELFLGLLGERTQAIVDRLAEASKTDAPLRSVWEYASDERGSALLMEFLALANHRKAIREAIGEGGERVRQAQLQALTAKWKEYGIDADTFPPPAVIFLISAIPRMLQLEEAVGTRTGHEEVVALVERYLDQLEPRARQRGRRARNS